jgi:anthranilate synthase component 2
MMLVIDNYDSFTYNLVQYLGEMDVPMEVHRNDQITLDEIAAKNPERILISPGPCSPKEAGLSNEIIKAYAGKIPLLGVCLGHQCIGYSFGAEIVVNHRLMHGKTSPMKHNGKDLFEGIPSPFNATRYHSLIVNRVPHCRIALKLLRKQKKVKLWVCDIKRCHLWGVQFHPESILTEHGKTLLR